MIRMKLRTQILLYLIICISVVFAVQLRAVNRQMRELQQQQADKLNDQLVQSKASEIGAWLNQRLSEIRIVAQQDCFKKQHTSEGVSYLREINTFVGETYGDLEQPFLLSNAEGVVALDDGNELDISQREFFQQAFASQKEYTISKPLISRVEWQRVVVISYPIKNSAQQRTGYILGSLLLSKLNEILTEIDLYGGIVWIMDGEGRVLAEDNNHNHGASIAQCPQSQNYTQMAGRLENTDHGSYPINDPSKIKKTLLFASIPNVQGWRLCVLASNEIIFAAERRFTRSILETWGGLLLSILLCSLFYVRSISRPLDQLARAMDAVDLDRPGKPYISSGTEEIRGLSQSFNRMSARILTLHQRVLSEQQSKREAEQRVLQAQINPHFLYNTLDTIAWKAMDHDACEVADIINALSRFFRIALSDGAEYIPLDDEVEHVYSYLFIQQVRYADKLDFDLYLADELRTCRVLKLLMQPLVENALYHGIRPKDGSGRIIVRIRPRGDQICFLVWDDGVGIPVDQLHILRKNLEYGLPMKGFGLYNITQRLRLTYGKAGSLQIFSRPGRGTLVRMVVPKQEGDNCDENADS